MRYDLKIALLPASHWNFEYLNDCYKGATNLVEITLLSNYRFLKDYCGLYPKYVSLLYIIWSLVLWIWGLLWSVWSAVFWLFTGLSGKSEVPFHLSSPLPASQLASFIAVWISQNLRLLIIKPFLLLVLKPFLVVATNLAKSGPCSASPPINSS